MIRARKRMGKRTAQSEFSRSSLSPWSVGGAISQYSCYIESTRLQDTEWYKLHSMLHQSVSTTWTRRGLSLHVELIIGPEMRSLKNSSARGNELNTESGVRDTQRKHGCARDAIPIRTATKMTLTTGTGRFSDLLRARTNGRPASCLQACWFCKPGIEQIGGAFLYEL